MRALRPRMPLRMPPVRMPPVRMRRMRMRRRRLLLIVGWLPPLVLSGYTRLGA